MVRCRRRLLRAILVVVTLFGVLFMSGPPRVSATTGDTYVLPPSRYKVPSALFPLYHGKYSLVSVGKGARIPSGLRIGRNCLIGSDVLERDFQRYLSSNGHVASEISSGETVDAGR